MNTGEKNVGTWFLNGNMEVSFLLILLMTVLRVITKFQNMPTWVLKFRNFYMMVIWRALPWNLLKKFPHNVISCLTHSQFRYWHCESHPVFLFVCFGSEFFFFWDRFFCFFEIDFFFYNVVLISAIQQCKSAIIILTSPSSPASSLTPIPSFLVITEHETGVPAIHSNFPPALHLMPDSVNMLVLLSPPSPSPTELSFLIRK